jgi:hypothetical protein
LHLRHLLAHKTIYHIQDLVAQAGLAQCSNARCYRQRPQKRHDHTDRANRSFIDPALLTNHSQHAASGFLQCQREGSLHTNNGLEIATFLQLDHHLVLVPYMLRLVAL